MKEIILTETQQGKLEDLWFVFGNHGKKHSMPNHHFIQRFLDHGVDLRDFYKPSIECQKAVDTILETERDQDENS